MFFDIELLCFQRKGRFAATWLAATRGISQLTRKQIDEVQIIKLCDELQQFIMSMSNKPKRRISLSLSAKLVHGIIIIHNKQVSILMGVVMDYLHSINRPIFKKTTEAKPPRVLTKKPRKSKVVLSEEITKEPQPAQLTIDDLARAFAEMPRATVDSITLQEEPSIYATRQVEDVFGDLGGVDAELHVLENAVPLQRQTSQFETILKEITLPEQVPREAKSEDLEIQEGQPPRKKARLTEPPLISVTPSESAVIPMAVHGASLETERTFEPSAVAVASLEVQTGIIDVSPPYQPRSPRAAAVRKDKYYVQLKTKTKGIIRSSDIDAEIYKVKDQGLALVPMYEKFLEDDDIELFNFFFPRDEGPLRDTSRSSIRSSSGNFFGQMLRNRSSESIPQSQIEGMETLEEMPQMIIPESMTSMRLSRTSTPIRSTEFGASAVPATLQVIVEDPQEIIHSQIQSPFRISAPAAQSTGIQPADVEQSLQQPLDKAAEQIINEDQPIQVQDQFPMAQTEPVVTQTDSLRLHQSIKQRRQAMLQIVKNWNFNEGELTITSVCEPKNQKVLADAFADLLYLSKHKYVKLIAYMDSIELKSIEKGLKML